MWRLDLDARGRGAVRGSWSSGLERARPLRVDSLVSFVTARMRLADLAALALLTVVWWTAVWIVDPRGDFPLNDDWGYAVPVRSLVEEGTLRLPAWQSMPMLTHALWGAGFAAVFGFSFTTLRLSTLVFAWAGVLALYGLLRSLGCSARSSTLGAAVLAVQPLYFALAFSFMTDVPFVVLLIAGSAAWVQSTRTESPRWRAVATVLAVAATLDRQIGLAMPLAWAGADALRLGLGRRWLRSALLPLGIVVATLVAYERIVSASIGLPALYHAKSAGLLEALRGLARLRGLSFPLERTSLSLVYLGLFTLPFVLAAALPIARQRWVIASAAAAFVFGVAFAVTGAAMPLTGNVWVDFGIGPRTLEGSAPRAPGLVWALVTGLGTASGWLLLVVLTRSLVVRLSSVAPRAMSGRRALLPARVGHFLGRASELLRGSSPVHESGIGVPVWAALAGTALIGFVPTAIAYGPFFDRYLLAQVPFVLALVAVEVRPHPQHSRIFAAGVALTAVTALFSVAGTHDYLAWQRARWALVEHAEHRAIARGSLEGGFEVDNEPTPQGMPVERDGAPYRLALSELPEHEIVEELPVRSWLPWAIESVYLLRKQEEVRISSHAAVHADARGVAH